MVTISKPQSLPSGNESVAYKGNLTDGHRGFHTAIFMPPDPDVRVGMINLNVFDAKADDLSATTPRPFEHAPDQAKFRRLNLFS